MCRAATFVPPEGDSPFRVIANDIAHEIKVNGTLPQESRFPNHIVLPERHVRESLTEAILGVRRRD